MGYLVTDENGTIVEANQAALKMLDRRQDEMTGEPLASFIHPQERQSYFRGLDALRTEGRLSLELRIETVDGPSFDAELTAARRTLAGACVRFAASPLDAQRRRSAQTDGSGATRERQPSGGGRGHANRARAVQHPLGHAAGLCHSALARLPRPLRQPLLRGAIRQVAGRRCYEYLFNRSEPCETCETYSVLTTGQPHHWEWTGPDGRNYDIHDFPFTDVDGSRLIMEVGLDVTEMKQAQAAVQAERGRFLGVLETLPMVLALLRPDHRVEWVNRAIGEALGDNVGRLCYASQFGRDAPCTECQAFVPLQTGQPHHWEWRLPNGRDFDIYNFPFTDADGAPMILEMDIDVTEQRQAEEAVRRASQLCQQASSKPRSIRW